MTDRLSGTYVRLHQPKEPVVGIVILILLAAGALGLGYFLLIRPAEPVVVSLAFEQAAGLTSGDPVFASGARVGRVRRVSLTPDGRVDVLIEVDRGFSPRRDARAAILPLNLMGDRYVAYQPGTADAPLSPGTFVPGTAAAATAMILAELADRAAALALELQEVTNDTVRREVRETVEALTRALESVRALPVGQVRADLGEAVTRARRTGARADTLLAHAALDSAAARLRRLRPRFGEVATAAAEARATLARLQAALVSGDGTLARLRRDTAFQGDLRHIDSVMRARR